MRSLHEDPRGHRLPVVLPLSKREKAMGEREKEMSEFIITRKEIDDLVKALQEHRNDFFLAKKAYESCFARPVGEGRFFTEQEFLEANMHFPRLRDPMDFNYDKLVNEHLAKYFGKTRD